MKSICLLVGYAFLAVSFTAAAVEAEAPLKQGQGPGWVGLGKPDFVPVNGDPDTWQWKEDGVLYCTGQPVGVTRSVKTYTNFELVAEWRHLKSAGNSGIFVWAPEPPLTALKKKYEETGKGGLPKGIEVQVLDLGYKTRYEKDGKRKADWFTCHGDVFPVGTKMKPFPPTSPNGQRSFPKRNGVLPHGNWNHYYVRCVKGEVRLWVNGHEVSGGSDCDPATGYLCLESEGSPIEFRNLRVKELPTAEVESKTK